MFNVANYNTQGFNTTEEFSQVVPLVLGTTTSTSIFSAEAHFIHGLSGTWTHLAEATFALGQQVATRGLWSTSSLLVSAPNITRGLAGTWSVQPQFQGVVLSLVECNADWETHTTLEAVPDALFLTGDLLAEGLFESEVTLEHAFSGLWTNASTWSIEDPLITRHLESDWVGSSQEMLIEPSVTSNGVTTHDAIATWSAQTSLTNDPTLSPVIVTEFRIFLKAAWEANAHTKYQFIALWENDTQFTGEMNRSSACTSHWSSDTSLQLDSTITRYIESDWVTSTSLYLSGGIQHSCDLLFMGEAVFVGEATITGDFNCDWNANGVFALDAVRQVLPVASWSAPSHFNAEGVLEHACRIDWVGGGFVLGGVTVLRRVPAPKDRSFVLPNANRDLIVPESSRVFRPRRQ